MMKRKREVSVTSYNYKLFRHFISRTYRKYRSVFLTEVNTKENSFR